MNTKTIPDEVLGIEGLLKELRTAQMKARSRQSRSFLDSMKRDAHRRKCRRCLRLWLLIQKHTHARRNGGSCNG